MEYSDKEIQRFREQLVDYYGSATPFFPMATADVIRVEQMTDDEVIEETKKLRLT